MVIDLKKSDLKFASSETRIITLKWIGISDGRVNGAVALSIHGSSSAQSVSEKSRSNMV